MDKKGLIEVATGPMFSGKTLWLIKKMEGVAALKTPYLAIRFGDDKRYSDHAISSHDGTHFTAQNAKTAADIKKLLDKNPNIKAFGIDEVQFFDIQLADVLNNLREKGVTVYAAGLDTDFLGNEWETSTQIINLADIVNKLTAVCSVCDEKIATKTQRLVDGKPASKNSPRILIGTTESYTARCAIHHQITI